MRWLHVVPEKNHCLITREICGNNYFIYVCPKIPPNNTNEYTLFYQINISFYTSALKSQSNSWYIFNHFITISHEYSNCMTRSDRTLHACFAYLRFWVDWAFTWHANIIFGNYLRHLTTDSEYGNVDIIQAIFKEEGLVLKYFSWLSYLTFDKTALKKKYIPRFEGKRKRSKTKHLLFWARI